MNFITIDHLIKRVKISSELLNCSISKLKGLSFDSNSRIFNLDKSDKNEHPKVQFEKNGKVMTNLVSFKKLLNYNHINLHNNNLNLRKWVFITENTNDTNDTNLESNKIYILSNQYGFINIYSNKSYNRNVNINDWYLTTLDYNNYTKIVRKIDEKSIIEYIDDIEKSDDLLNKSFELKVRLSKIIGEITFENSFEYGWYMKNAYKITIKKYENNSIYLENKENGVLLPKKVKISENRLIKFYQKNKDIFKEIQNENIENMNAKIIEKYEIKKKEEQRILDALNAKLGKLTFVQTQNYNDMSVEYRINIHKKIQKENPQLFIKNTYKRKYEIQSCKPFLNFN